MHGETMKESKYIVYCTQRTILIFFHIWMASGNVINHYTKIHFNTKTKTC